MLGRNGWMVHRSLWGCCQSITLATQNILPIATTPHRHPVVVRLIHMTASSYQRQKDMVVVSILGPPNAGKSTLFNRLMCKESNRSYRLSSENRHRKAASKGRLGVGGAKQQQQHQESSGAKQRWRGGAIVSSVPGTTRDRRECIGRIGGTKFRLMDTAGVDGDRLQHLQGVMHNKSGTNVELAQEWDDHLVQRQMMLQTLQAARQSDLILLMFDARVGVTQDLAETARWLRKNYLPPQQSRKSQQQQPPNIAVAVDEESDTSDINSREQRENNERDGNHKKSTNPKLPFSNTNPHHAQQRVVLLANKLEGDRWLHDDESPVLDNLAEAARIGFGEAIPISAEHGEGMADICEVIEELAQIKRGAASDEGKTAEQLAKEQEEEEADEEKPLQLAILGRQNVGKSTLVNRLLKEDRVIAGEKPGLTRDSIAIEWEWNGRPVQLADTAGIRKLSQRDHTNAIENMAVLDALRAMKVADVAVLVLDAEARRLQRQELAIADAVAKEGRALVVAANKMDLIVEHDYTAEDYAQAVRDQIEARIPILRNTPVVAMSSLSGEGVPDLMPVVFQARDRWAQTVATGLLNRWLADVMLTHPPPPTSGRPTKIKYIIQTKGRPPTFLLFCNVEQLPDSYVRFLMRNFQDSFEMFGMEVRMSVKKSSSTNPYHDKRKRGGSGLGGRERKSMRRIKGRRENAERLLRRRKS